METGSAAAGPVRTIGQGSEATRKDGILLDHMQLAGENRLIVERRENVAKNNREFAAAFATN